MGLEISREEVVQAASLAQADGFIRQLGQGYQTILDSGGSNLSTGQRQLLVFARVIAHNPRIIIFDEATANIDTETERLIQKGMEAVINGRTSLIIAHRLSTIQHADRILALAAGTLVEEGTHAELLKKQGLYYNLYQFQYSQVVDSLRPRSR